MAANNTTSLNSKHLLITYVPELCCTFIGIISFDPQNNYKTDAIISHILQMNKLGFREVRKYVHSHKTIKKQSRDWNSLPDVRL